MALQIRKVTNALVPALVSEHNALQKEIVGGLETYAHYDKTATDTSSDPSTPSASDLQVTAPDGDGAAIAKSRVLAIDLWAKYQTHLADYYESDLIGGAHKEADAAPALVQPTTSTSLANLETFADALYTDYNAHIDSTTYHPTADTTNVASSAAATTQGTLDDRLNDLKAKLNLHIKSGPASRMIKVIPA